MLYVLGLNGRDRNRIDDVSHSAPPAEVIYRFIKPLQDRAYSNSIGRTLNSLVGVVAGVQVREDEYRCMACDLASRKLCLCHTGIDRSIVLDGAFDLQIRTAVLCDLRQPPAPCPLQRLFLTRRWNS